MIDDRTTEWLRLHGHSGRGRGTVADGFITRTFEGSSVADIYQLDADAIHLPRYPVYRDRPLAQRQYPYYYARSDAYLDCQSSRFVLIGGRLSTLVSDSVVDPLRDLSSYWSGFFGEHFSGSSGSVVKYATEGGFRAYVGSRRSCQVVTPFPYETTDIPSCQFYLDDPGLLVRLNDKGSLHELSSQALPCRCYSPDEFRQDLWRDEWRLPFVVKLTDPSGGGDGVRICLDEAGLARAREAFRAHSVKVEPYLLDIRNNYNINVHVSRMGQVSFLGGSRQRIGPGGQYHGNSVDLLWRPSQDIWSICLEVVRKAHQMGWYGICGVDVVETESGQLFCIDLNFRLNGSTPFFLMQRHFFYRFTHPVLKTGYFHFYGQPGEFLGRFKHDIERCELTPVGMYYRAQGDGITRIYAAVASNADPEQCEHVERGYAARYLISGLGL